MTHLDIAEVVQNARDFNPRETMTSDIRPAIEALFRELAESGIDHVLVGGVALLYYVEGRNTQDVVLIVRPDDMSRMPWAATLQDCDFGRAQYHGVRVDLLLRSNPLFDWVATHERASVEFAGRVVPIATRRGLLLLTLYALPSLYRTGNLARAALYEADIRMLRLGQGASINDDELLEQLRPVLPKPGDLRELARILEEHRAASGRFR
jgi:hypothetical protein